MNAFIAVEGRPPALARANGLARTQFNANPRAAALAKFGVKEDDMIGVTGRGLHLATEQQGVLMRDEQLAVIGYGWPTGALHQHAVQRHALNGALLAELLDLRLRDAAAVVFGERRDALVGWDWLAAQGEGYAHAFRKAAAIRAAIDRRHARHDAPIAGAREVAFFPPMTGG